jgi:hypothetical protein
MTIDNLKNPHQDSKKQAAKWWALASAMLVVSALPCPECGTPLGLHIWPLLPLVTAIRMAVRQSKSTEQAVVDDESFSQPASEEA